MKYLFQWLAGGIHSIRVNRVILQKPIRSTCLMESDAAGLVDYESRKTPAITAIDGSFVVTSGVRQRLFSRVSTRGQSFGERQMTPERRRNAVS